MVEMTRMNLSLLVLAAVLIGLTWMTFRKKSDAVVVEANIEPRVFKVGDVVLIDNWDSFGESRGTYLGMEFVFKAAATETLVPGAYEVQGVSQNHVMVRAVRTGH